MIEQLLHWFAMGGYSIYVWPAYGLLALFVVMNILGLRWQVRQTRNRLQQWFKRQN